MTTEAKDPGGHRYAAADAELSGYFTSAVGVRAQSYQGSGGGAFESDALHDQRLRAMRAGGMVWFDRIAATLAQLPAEHGITLADVYTPHSWPATWLVSALATPWGGGSMVTVALSLPRAPADLRRWLLDADRPALDEWKRRARICAGLASDAEDLRMPAVAAYDALRIARIKSEARDRWERMSAVERRLERQRRKDEAEQAALRASVSQRVAVAFTGEHEARLAEACAVVGEAMARRAA